VGLFAGAYVRRQKTTPTTGLYQPLIWEGDLKGWSTVLVTALGSWEKTVPRAHYLDVRRIDFGPTTLRRAVLTRYLHCNIKLRVELWPCQECKPFCALVRSLSSSPWGCLPALTSGERRQPRPRDCINRWFENDKCNYDFTFTKWQSKLFTCEDQADARMIMIRVSLYIAAQWAVDVWKNRQWPPSDRPQCEN
jgi:hypothetical protein